jgi:hypothetical protein
MRGVLPSLLTCVESAWPSSPCVLLPFCALSASGIVLLLTALQLPEKVRQHGNRCTARLEYRTATLIARANEKKAQFGDCEILKQLLLKHGLHSKAEAGAGCSF